MTIANVSIKKLTNFISQEIRPDLIRVSLTKGEANFFNKIPTNILHSVNRIKVTDPGLNDDDGLVFGSLFISVSLQTYYNKPFAH